MVYQIPFQLSKLNLLQKNILALIFSFAVIGLFLPKITYSEGVPSENIQPPLEIENSDLSISLQGNTFIVDSTGDEHDESPDGLCMTKVGTCTLRAALDETNVNPDQNLIRFNISTSDPGYLDSDFLNLPNSGDNMGGDDLWIVNYDGSPNDLFKTAIVIDVSSQTNSQFDSNKTGPEIQVNFSSDKKIAVQNTVGFSVNGASTIAPAGPPESSLRYKGKLGKVNNRDWTLTTIAGMVKVGNEFLVAGDQKILRLDADGKLIATYDKSTSLTQGFNSARCLVQDNFGYIYVCDSPNYNRSPTATGIAKVQKYDSNGNYISTIGSFGAGLSQFTAISDVTFDSSNNMYVTDPDLLRVSKFDSNGNYLLTWGSSGTGNAQFGSGTLLSGGAQLIREGMGIDADSSNNIYVVDTGNRKLKKFDSNGNYLTSWSTVEGSEPAVGFGMAAWDIYINSNDQIFTVKSATFNQDQVVRIQEFNTSGSLVATSWGRGGPVPDRMDHPTEMYIANDGTFYFLDSYDTPYIQIYDSSHNHLGWWGINAGDYGNYQSAWGLKFDSSGNLYVTDFAGKALKKLNSNLEGVSSWFANIDGSNISNPGAVRFFGVVDVDIDSQGYIYIYNFNASRIDKLDPNTGAIVLSWSTPNTSTGIVIDHNDNIYINQRGTNTIRKYNTSGIFISSFGGTGTGNGQFQLPGRLAVDSQNNIYATDQVRNNVQKFNSSGVFQFAWGGTGTGNSQFNQPYDLIFDQEGNLWIEDRGNQSIKKFDPNGNFISKWNGTGLPEDQGYLSGGFSGAGMDGIEIDNAGNIYVSNGQDGRIIQIFSYDQTGPVVTPVPFENNVTVSTSPNLTGTVADALSPVASLQFSFSSDLSNLQNCISDDGTFDEKSETFSCNLGNLSFGQHTVYFKAIDNANNSSTSSYIFTVIDPTIVLVSPANNAVIDNPLPLLDWNSAFTADSYAVYLDDNLIATVDDTSYKLTDSQRLQYNSEHTWKVQGFIGSSMMAESSIFNFSVIPPTYNFEPIYPVNVIIDDFTPLFDWTDITVGSDVTGYNIYVDNELVGIVEIGTSEYQLPSDKALLEGDHNWQVVAYYKDVNDENVEVARSSSAKFTISIPVPGELPATGDDGNHDGENSNGGNGGGIEKPKNDKSKINIEVLTFTPLAVYGGIGTTAILLSLITVGFVNTVKRLEVILAVLVPKKRKYWGIIFNENNLNPLPFAVVRLFDKDRKLVSSIASDLNGRYGFLVNKADNYILEIEAEGFNKYRNEFYVDPDREVVKDIALQRIDQLPNVANRLRFYVKNNFVPFMNIFGLIIMLLGLVWTLYIISTKGIDQITFAGSLIYICLFVFNVLFLVTSIMREIGKVKDILTGSGVGGASVRFYNEERQIDIALTNVKGEIKANMKPGKYKIKVYKPGYETVGEDLKEMNLKREGYLEEDISLKKISSDNQENPFTEEAI